MFTQICFSTERVPFAYSNCYLATEYKYNFFGGTCRQVIGIQVCSEAANYKIMGQKQVWNLQKIGHSKKRHTPPQKNKLWIVGYWMILVPLR